MNLLKTLNKDQLKAATYSGKAKRIIVIAGAGTGKTRTLVARLLFLLRDQKLKAAQVAMLTFTNRAAKEMKGRLDAEIDTEGLFAGTFHSFCLNIMRRMPKSFNLSSFQILDAQDQLELIRLCKEKAIEDLDSRIKKAFPKQRELLSIYSFAKNSLVHIDKLLEQKRLNIEPFKSRIKIIIKEYEEKKKEAHYLDFDDLLYLFAKTLYEKPKLAEYLGNRFKEITIDEFQDTNPIQLKILEILEKSGSRLFCVGDPAQSIYKFRGADFKNISDFIKTSKRSIELKLPLNYRSSQEILSLSNDLLRKSKIYNYFSKLESNRGYLESKPVLKIFESKEGEASWICKKIIEIKNNSNLKLSDFIILVRTAYAARYIESELIRHGINYYFLGGRRIQEAAHIKDVISFLKAKNNPNDFFSWLRFLTLWPKIGYKTAEKIIDKKIELRKDIKEALDSLNLKKEPKEAFKQAVKILSPVLKEKYIRDYKKRLEDFKVLEKVLYKYSNLDKFFDDFSLDPFYRQDASEENDSVGILTVHSAKGTEAEVCFVAQSQLYPHYLAETIEDYEEERRIFYVALTRAKSKLFISSSEENRDSFIEELDKNLIEISIQKIQEYEDFLDIF